MNNRALKFERQSWLLVFIALISFFLIADLQQHNEPEGLDPSWRNSYNYFMENDFSFGDEVVFTYGPAAPLFLNSFSDHLYWAKIGTDLLMAAMSAFIVWLIGRKTGWAAACLMALAHMYNYGQDTYYFALQVSLLFLIALYASANRLVKYVLILGSVMLIGGLSYIKFTYFVTGLFIALLIAGYFLLKRETMPAVTTIVASVSSFILYWVMLGQSIRHLPAYIFNSIQISSGYTPAMSLPGPQVTIYVGMIMVFICVILVIPNMIRNLKSERHNLVLFVSLAGIGAVVWKEAFVRHDLHLLYFYYNLMYVAVFIWCIHALGKFERLDSNAYSLWMRPAWIRGTIIIIFIVPLLAISKGYYGQFIDSRIITDKINKVLASTKLILNPHAIYTQRSQLAEQLGHIRAGSPYAGLKALVKNDTIDIYNYNQNIILQNGLNWAPRPVFQSYSAYTEKLLEINEDHIVRNGPEYVLFNNETIDSRLPLSDDNLWVRQLFHGYHYVISINNQLLLKKNDTFEVPELQEVLTDEVSFNEEILIPSMDKPLYLSAEIEDSNIGKLGSLLLKPPVISLVTMKTDGTSHVYRVIPDMIAQPTLLSPLLEDNNDVVNYLHGVSTERVASIRFVVSKPAYYKGNIKIKLYEDTWKTAEVTEVYNIKPSKIVTDHPLENRFVYGQNTLYFHPNAELYFSINGEDTAEVSIGLLPEVKVDNKSNGVNLYWESNVDGIWTEFGKLRYHPGMFGDDFIKMKAAIPIEASLIRLRIDGGISDDTAYDWAVVNQITIQ